MWDIVILGASLIDQKGRWDVGIQDAKIGKVMPEGTLDDAHKAKERIDADGLLLMPGLIDSHVHTRDPGYSYKEDFFTVTRAAAAGGITTIMAMPNTNPPLTNASALFYARKYMGQKNVVHVAFVGGALAAYPKWVRELADAGAIALDVHDDPYAYGSEVWVNLFQEAKKTNIPLCFYLMDGAIENLRRKEMRSRGYSEEEEIICATDGLTESVSICRIYGMAAYFDHPVVLRMVSTAGGIQAVRQMKQLYPEARVYVEVNVHYLFLTSDIIKKVGARAHIHPSLRTQNDVDALWEAVCDGTVDYISSDHAPHAPEEKRRSRLGQNASGIIGLETMLPLLWNAKEEGRISAKALLYLCCERPAQIYGLTKKGKICEEYDADLILLDSKKEWIVNSERGYSKGAPSPFEGWKLKGKPRLTICGGRKVYQDGAGAKDY